VLDYTGGSTPAAAVKSILTASYYSSSNHFASGQIYSSTANAGSGLGWVDNGASRVKIAKAIYGDANLDGIVETEDLSRVLTNYDATNRVWNQGDFNYDGAVNVSDLSKVMANYDVSLANPSLTLSGGERVQGGTQYTLTLGLINGISVAGYTIRWGDGSWNYYTAAQMAELGGQASHVYADGAGAPTIVVDLTDASGAYLGVAAKAVAVEAQTSAAPVIDNFYLDKVDNQHWIISGVVRDADDPVQGDTISFGGVLESFHATATVAADGAFSITMELSGIVDGLATAQTCDPHGVVSELATCWVIV
jgi:hypothetical protein